MKKILLVTIILILIFTTNIVEAKALSNIDIIYFGTESCFDCIESSNYINKLIENLNNQNIKINLFKYETLNEKDNELFQDYSNSYSVPEDKQGIIPTVFIGDTFFAGKKEVMNNLENEIFDIVNGKKEYFPIEIQSADKEVLLKKATEILDNFTPLTIILAGFLDGFNPCAIAMLLFFISFLMMSDRNGKEILLTGTSYILGVFIAYFGIGLGIFRFANLFQSAKSIMIGIYSSTIIMSIILMILNYKDYTNIKSGHFEKVKTQLPKRVKHTIHNYIRNNSLRKFIYVTAFVNGFIISFLEFFCTGQIYLPTISYVLSAKNSVATGITYLFLYNVAFITPLIAICIALYKGKEVMDISQKLVDKLHIIKILGAVFFLIISIIMTIQLFKII
ncbi:MAG: cytochrome c biosis protein transrane region [Clostridiaceae bacterium]|jgi:cytochrome c biogenesis protein CcdA|nr:cytochrome c biosis protein transrane region [Clostridiaceae bacterium]